MIMHCNFEELGALRQGADSLLGEHRVGDAPVVAAPPEGWETVEALLSRLSGDLAIETLAEQRAVTGAVSLIVRHLKEEMDLFISTTHPADESAVCSYFLYAHSLAVLKRLLAMGEEMEALIEVVTGRPVTDAVAETFLFPS